MKFPRKIHLTSIVFFVLALIFAAASFGLETRPRLIPLSAGIITLIVMGLVLINDHFPAPFLKKLNAGLLDSYNPEPAAAEPDEGNPGKDTAAVLVWMVFFFLLILLFGFAAGIPVFTFAFLKFRGRTGWIISLITAGLVTAAVLIIFNVFMGVSLFKGVIMGEILPPV